MLEIQSCTTVVNIHLGGSQDMYEKKKKIYIYIYIYIQCSVEGLSKSSLQAKMCKFLAAFVAFHSTA